MNSTPHTDRLTRTVARNPASWTVEKIAACRFRATCGDRAVTVQSAYGRIFYVHNVERGSTHRVDAPDCCDCADFQTRQIQFHTCCYHLAAVVAVQRAANAERMVDNVIVLDADPFADEAPDPGRELTPEEEEALEQEAREEWGLEAAMERELREARAEKAVSTAKELAEMFLGCE